MHLVGRYEQLRGMEAHTGAYTPPVILDKGRAQDDYHLLPYGRSEEWWKSPDGRWKELWKIGRALRHYWDDEKGAVGYNGTTASYGPSIGFPAGDTTIVQTLKNFSTNYVAGTSGAANGVFMQNAVAKTLNHVYGFFPSYNGTAGNVTDLNYEVRSKAAGSFLPDTTGPGLLASGSWNPSSNTGWMRGNSSAISLSVPITSYYWIIFGDANGNATDFVKCNMGSTSNYPQTVQPNFEPWAGEFTTNGFTTINGATHFAGIVAVWSDGSAQGDPFTVQANPTSDANQKGLYVAGFQTSKSVWGASGTITAANVNGLNIWEGSAGPSGSGWKNQGTRLLYYLGNIAGAACSSLVTLTALTAYRFVLKGSGNFAAPSVRQIGTVVTGVNSGSATDLTNAMPGGGGWYYTAENSGSWSDTTTQIPEFTVWVGDDVASSAAGPFNRIFTGQ